MPALSTAVCSCVGALYCNTGSDVDVQAAMMLRPMLRSALAARPARLAVCPRISSLAAHQWTSSRSSSSAIAAAAAQPTMQALEIEQQQQEQADRIQITDAAAKVRNHLVQVTCSCRVKMASVL